MNLLRGKSTKLTSYIATVVDARLSMLYSGQSSLKRSYSFVEEEQGRGLLFVLRYPSGLQLDSKTYFQLYDIIAPAIASVKTMIRPLTFQLVGIDDQQLETSQGFFFPWRDGRAKRLVGTIDEILEGYDLNKEVPIMDKIVVNRNVTTFLVTGTTGSGKTEASKYFVQVFARMKNRSKTKKARVILFDPKKGAGARWAKLHDPSIELVVPHSGDRPEDYIPRCNAKLEELVSEINSKQNRIFENAKKVNATVDDLDEPPTWAVFEEFEAVTLGMSPRSSQVQDLYRLLTQIALMGRESKVGLCIVSQIARNDVIPIPIRSQMLVKILLGVIDRSSTTYLFGDLSDDIPLPLGSVGSGIISIHDGYHYGIEPVEMPTVLEDE